MRVELFDHGQPRFGVQGTQLGQTVIASRPSETASGACASCAHVPGQFGGKRHEVCVAPRVGGMSVADTKRADQEVRRMLQTEVVAGIVTDTTAANGDRGWC